MPPASKAKSKDKRATSKEPTRASLKTPETSTTGGATAVTASGYNPVSGTFHTPPPSSFSPGCANSRFHHIEDTNDHSGQKNEPEDHKEKTSQVAMVPGVDSEKREKIRQKNEKKHQRQKEKQAQELHELCSSFLMSRKLEKLAQELVSMGFSSERATMALIKNQGRVEESVAWLLEGGDTFGGGVSGGTLKIDISEELDQIYEMETKFKCSKQEVERAVVASAGDLRQAAETLKTQKTAALLQPTAEPAADPVVEKIFPVVEKSFPVGGSSSSAALPSRTELLNAEMIGNKLKNIQLGSFQRPQPTAPHGVSYIPTSGPLDHHRQNFVFCGPLDQHPSQPALAVSSSLGLFPCLGSNRGSEPCVDWNADRTLQFDYKNIDWSLDRLPFPLDSSNWSWMSFSSLGFPANGVGPETSGSGGSGSSSGGEWSSPFEENDLFGLPRQLVSSPSI